MNYINGNEFQLNNTCVTLGKFDGIHNGHRVLLSKMKEIEKEGLTSVVFTFNYHPSNLFSKTDLDLIYTEEEKVAVFSKIAPDVLISYPFTTITSGITALDFIKNILVGQLGVKAIIVGEDFRFGKERAGSVLTLLEHEAEFGYHLYAFKKADYKNTVISSTRIRNELSLGHIEEVNAMLGSPYFIQGTVIHGKEIGRQMSIRTANILPGEHKLLSPEGVYVSMVICDGATYRAVTNIGTNPTVTSNGRVIVETHLLDCEADLYDKIIRVELYHYIRPELKFNSLLEMKTQIELDIELTKQYFKAIS